MGQNPSQTLSWKSPLTCLSLFPKYVKGDSEANFIALLENGRLATRFVRFQSCLLLATAGHPEWKDSGHQVQRRETNGACLWSLPLIPPAPFFSHFPRNPFLTAVTNLRLSCQLHRDWILCYSQFHLLLHFLPKQAGFGVRRSQFKTCFCCVDSGQPLPQLSLWFPVLP